MERPNHCPNTLEVAINSIPSLIHPLAFILSVQELGHLITVVNLGWGTTLSVFVSLFSLLIGWWMD